MAAQDGPLRDSHSGRFVSSGLPEGWSACGIYRLEFPDGRFYIGSAINVRTRILEHKGRLRANNHSNPRLQRGWNKFNGIAAFPILFCSESDLIFYEQLAIDGLKPELNLSFVAGRPPTMTDEVRGKISISLRGRVKTPEHLLKLSLAQKGVPRKPHTVESKAKLALSLKGNKNSQGSVRTPAEKEKLSILMTGNQHARGHKRSVEHRGAISAALLGNKRTLGRVRPPHEREQISLKMKQVWAERRANAAR